MALDRRLQEHGESEAIIRRELGALWKGLTRTDLLDSIKDRAIAGLQAELKEV
jgi:hypothetical protein